MGCLREGKEEDENSTSRCRLCLLLPGLRRALLEDDHGQVDGAEQHPGVGLALELGGLAVVEGARDVRGAVFVLAARVQQEQAVRRQLRVGHLVGLVVDDGPVRAVRGDGGEA